MLIEFSIRNYKSFREEQRLSMVAGSSSELRKNHVFTSQTRGTPPLLKSTIMFGPNTSGKSNFIKALRFFQETVIHSAKNRQEGENIETIPFLLDAESQKGSTELEMIFIQEGIRYQYGFCLTREKIEHEWLLAYPGARAQRWFERKFDRKRNQYDWYFGSHFKGQKDIIRMSTRENALYLSTAVQLNHPQLKPVYEWFTNKLVIILSKENFHPSFQKFSLRQCKEKKGKQQILSFLQNADLHIDDIRIQKDNRADSSLYPGEEYPLFIHKTQNSNNSVAFQSEEESQGAMNLFTLSGVFLDVFRKGSVLVIDEIDSSLHPALLRYIIQWFHDEKKNPSQAQLICNAHDITIMESHFLRRDQVWFVEKSREMSTQLFSLAEFSPRKGEAYMRGYLHGRYGALPYLGGKEI